jgi:replicative DNA helicase
MKTAAEIKAEMEARRAARAAKSPASETVTDERAASASPLPPREDYEPSAEEIKAATAPPSKALVPVANPAGTNGQHRNGQSYLPDIHRLLPASAESEKGVLGSFLLAPIEVGQICENKVITPELFHTPAHATIYEQLMMMWRERMPIDIITLTERLRNLRCVDEVGGAAFVTQLFTFLPTAANVGYYIELLEEKFTLREIIRVSTKAAARAYDEQSEVTNILCDVEESVKSIVTRRYEVEGVAVSDFKTLLDFDTKQDPDCVLGRRWLCRGGSALWIGQAGIGKSSLAMQAGMFWALGRALWGIKPVRPLKSLFIQAENDEGDLAEMAQGVAQALFTMIPNLDPAEAREAMVKNIVFVRDTIHTGDAFGRSAARLIAKHKPDLVWGDPLLSYCGDDISQQKVASRFLRETLNPIAFDTGIVWMFAHHTGKPDKDAAAKSHWNQNDMAYAAFGSSELVNWARAVNVLKGVGDGQFKLQLTKRGKRAGALDPAGNFTDTLHLRHATEGIAWEQTDEPEEDEQVPKQGGQKTRFVPRYNAEEVLTEMSAIDEMTATDLQKHMAAECGMSAGTFYNIWKQLKRDDKVQMKGDGWIRRMR